jgi:hypothetical protein
MAFPDARQFVPRYSLQAALTTYAIVGGIPAYLERFDDRRSVEANVCSRVLAPTSMFQIDPLYLLNEALREPRHYFAVLEAIGAGHRTLSEIAQAAGLADKAARLTPPGWQAHLALFSRSGFTEDLKTQADRQGAFLVDLEQVVAPV